VVEVKEVVAAINMVVGTGNNSKSNLQVSIILEVMGCVEDGEIHHGRLLHPIGARVVLDQVPVLPTKIQVTATLLIIVAAKKSVGGYSRLEEKEAHQSKKSGNSSQDDVNADENGRYDQKYSGSSSTNNYYPHHRSSHSSSRHHQHDDGNETGHSERRDQSQTRHSHHQESHSSSMDRHRSSSTEADGNPSSLTKYHHSSSSTSSSKKTDHHSTSDMDFCSIHVSGFGSYVTEDAIQKAFEKFGRIRKIKVPKDYLSAGGEKNRGYAFVAFEDAEACQMALKNPPKLDDREVSVEYSKKQVLSSSTTSGRGSSRSDMSGTAISTSSSTNNNSDTWKSLSSTSFSNKYEPYKAKDGKGIGVVAGKTEAELKTNEDHHQQQQQIQQTTMSTEQQQQQYVAQMAAMYPGGFPMMDPSMAWDPRLMMDPRIWQQYMAQMQRMYAFYPPPMIDPITGSAAMDPSHQQEAMGNSINHGSVGTGTLNPQQQAQVDPMAGYYQQYMRSMSQMLYPQQQMLMQQLPQSTITISDNTQALQTQQQQPRHQQSASSSSHSHHHSTKQK